MVFKFERKFEFWGKKFQKETSSKGVSWAIVIFLDFFEVYSDFKVFFCFPFFCNNSCYCFRQQFFFSLFVCFVLFAC